MAIPVLGLSTFLKLTALPPVEQLRDVQEYADPGGYDRYRCFKDCTKGYIQHHKPLEEIALKASSIGNDSERKDTEHLLELLVAWRKKNPWPGFIGPEGFWKSPNAIFSVRVSPEIAIASNKERFILSVYCHKSIRITPTTAGVEIIVMRKALFGKYQAGDRIGVLDLVAGKRFLSVPEFSHKAFVSQVDFLERTIAAVRPKAA